LQTIEAIASNFEKRVPQLELEFNEINQMPPNAALRLYEILQRKPAGTTLDAKAHSPIQNCGILVWLAADRRYIRSTSWMYFRPVRSGKRRRQPAPWDDEQDWWRFEEEESSLPNFGEMDYRTVLRLMNNYLPVKGLAGKVLTPALLDEFCLLDAGLMKEAVPLQSSAQHQPASGSDTHKETKNTVAADLGRHHLTEKRTWYIERNAQDRFTLKGGFFPSVMADKPELRQEDIRMDFVTKEDLLTFLERIQFCQNKDKIVMDGHQVVME